MLGIIDFSGPFQVLVVGVGDADIDELKLMASPPHDTSVYHVKDYGSIKQIQSVLAAKLCEEDRECSFLCFWGG